MPPNGSPPGVLGGLSASPGMAWGNAFVFVKPNLEKAISEDHFEGADRECSRLEEALTRAGAQLQTIKERTVASLGYEEAHIFRSQQTMLEDQSTIDGIRELIHLESMTACRAIQVVFDQYLALFADLDDSDYNKERMSDIIDVSRRLLRAVLDLSEPSLSELSPGQLIVAEELFPSDTALLDPKKAVGFVTEKGGITSHVAILAKNLGLPAAVKVTGALAAITAGQRIFLDTVSDTKAQVHVDPDEEVTRKLIRRREGYTAQRTMLREVLSLDAITIDGVSVELAANIGSVEEAQLAIENGAKGVGLFRTEFLFLGKRRIPGEEEQYNAYREVSRMFAPGTVIIRTLDVGGDKHVPALSIPNEENPFLGYRGLRVSLGTPELLEVQLRAALRANTEGNLKLMFPMVSAVEEVQRVLEVRDRIIDHLNDEGLPYNADMELGVMVELPSTLLILDDLCRHVDFFSVGTNDLTQYLFGADRMNGAISEYYRVFGPAVLRAIVRIVETAHSHGKWVGVCGELGGMPLAIPFLVGVGVDELSMSFGQLGEATHLIRSGSRTKLAKELVAPVLACETEESVRGLLQAAYDAYT